MSVEFCKIFGRVNITHIHTRLFFYYWKKSHETLWDAYSMCNYLFAYIHNVIRNKNKKEKWTIQRALINSSSSSKYQPVAKMDIKLRLSVKAEAVAAVPTTMKIPRYILGFCFQCVYACEYVSVLTVSVCVYACAYVCALCSWKIDLMIFVRDVVVFILWAILY